MAADIEGAAQAYVEAIIDGCAREGWDVCSHLRQVRNNEQRMHDLRASMRREMDLEPDEDAAAYTRSVVLAIDRTLLELERPKAEA